MKKGLEIGSTTTKIQTAWPKTCMFASGNTDHLLLVSTDDQNEHEVRLRITN